MKKYLVPALLVICVVSLGFMFGCGSSTSTTTTTTTTTVTISDAQLSTAKSGVLIASGGAAIGVSSTAVGGAAGTSPAASSVKSTWLRGFMGTPPPAFFTFDLTTITDGYFTPSGTELGGNMQPYIRLHTIGGDIVTGTYLSNKKIADLTPCSVEAIFAGSPTVPPVGLPGPTGGMANFVNNWIAASSGGSNPTGAYTSSTVYYPIKYMGDYLCWAYIYPTIEAKVNAGTQPFPYPAMHLNTPEAVNNDKIASLDSKMVFSNTATGELVLNMTCLPDGRVAVGDYYGSGKIMTRVSTMDVTAGLHFDTAGEPPYLVTFIGTNETDPLYTVVVNITSPEVGTGTGTIYDNTGAVVGTLTAAPGGGSVTIGGTTEVFTF
jgi:hypothetical protein